MVPHLFSVCRLGAGIPAASLVSLRPHPGLGAGGRSRRNSSGPAVHWYRKGCSDRGTVTI